MNPPDPIVTAAQLITQADGMLIAAGAGIGVDSGLPDFRGDEGFWRAYPPLAQAGVRFADIATPAAFREDPSRAWGFYGHRLGLYRDTEPHRGFAILLEMAQLMKHGAFVFTSNVDGQFQKAGFDADRVVECHGSIHRLQCIDTCSDNTFSAQSLRPNVDIATCRMTSDLPRCPSCGALARPAILMFNDSDWLPEKTERQYDRLEKWRRTVSRLVVLEVGAGTDIPSVRRFGESLNAPLVRINPRAAEVYRPADVGLPTGALEGLSLIQAAMRMQAKSPTSAFCETGNE